MNCPSVHRMRSPGLKHSYGILMMEGPSFIAERNVDMWNIAINLASDCLLPTMLNTWTENNQTQFAHMAFDGSVTRNLSWHSRSSRFEFTVRLDFGHLENYEFLVRRRDLFFQYYWNSCRRRYQEWFLGRVCGSLLLSRADHIPCSLIPCWDIRETHDRNVVHLGKSTFCYV